MPAESQPVPTQEQRERARRVLADLGLDEMYEGGILAALARESALATEAAMERAARECDAQAEGAAELRGPAYDFGAIAALRTMAGHFRALSSSAGTAQAPAPAAQESAAVKALRDLIAEIAPPYNACLLCGGREEQCCNEIIAARAALASTRGATPSALNWEALRPRILAALKCETCDPGHPGKMWLDFPPFDGDGGGVPELVDCAQCDGEPDKVALRALLEAGMPVDSDEEEPTHEAPMPSGAGEVAKPAPASEEEYRRAAEDMKAMLAGCRHWVEPGGYCVRCLLAAFISIRRAAPATEDAVRADPFNTLCMGRNWQDGYDAAKEDARSGHPDMQRNPWCGPRGHSIYCAARADHAALVRAAAPQSTPTPPPNGDAE